MADSKNAPARPEILWPDYYAPANSPVHVRNEIFIPASAETVWAWLVRAPLWPSWYANSHCVRPVDRASRGDLEAGSAFHWWTFSVPVTSRVQEFVPTQRIAWNARGIGLDAYHAWLIYPVGGGCHVLTEECQHGWGARLLNFLMPKRMYEGHELWLTSLRAQASKGLPPPL